LKEQSTNQHQKKKQPNPQLQRRGSPSPVTPLCEHALRATYRRRTLQALRRRHSSGGRRRRGVGRRRLTAAPPSLSGVFPFEPTLTNSLSLATHGSMQSTQREGLQRWYRDVGTSEVLLVEMEGSWSFIQRDWFRFRSPVLSLVNFSWDFAFCCLGG
jgi:hypothetical protein